jgi:hypothetical protein
MPAKTEAFSPKTELEARRRKLHKDLLSVSIFATFQPTSFMAV